MMKKKKDGFQGQKAIVLPRDIIDKYCVGNPLISAAYITDIGYYPRAKFHYRIRPQGIDQHILVYSHEGSGWAEIGDRKYTIHPGNFFIAPAGQYHRYAADAKDPWSIYWIHCKGPAVDAFIKTYFEKIDSFCGTLRFDDGRITLFDQMCKTLERGYGYDNLNYSNMILPHFLASFLFDEGLNEASRDNPQDLVALSISYMQKNMDKMLSVDALADQVNISASHYSFLFKKNTGFPPIEYFNHLKIQKACQYLQFTEMRVKEIANKVGIEDPYYFSRLFTKIMSMSPKDYRNKFTYQEEAMGIK
ncbi:MAG: AraC family transcriptional regulator [Sphingobacteriales bacterium]|nr:AraC family transcriptional regulator [Sphingobacteriales bacterium]